MSRIIKKLLREGLNNLNETFTHNNQFLYHTTNMRNYKDVTRYGLLPQFGDTVKQAYGGYYDFGDNKTKYEDDDDNKPAELNIDGLLFFSEYPMLHYSYHRSEKFDIDKALVCVIKRNPTIFHKVDDYPRFTDYRNKRVDSIEYINVCDLPIIIETGDWFSFEEQSPIKLLQGRYIIEFMKHNFPEKLKHAMEFGY